MSKGGQNHEWENHGFSWPELPGAQELCTDIWGSFMQTKLGTLNVGESYVSLSVGRRPWQWDQDISCVNELILGSPFPME